MKVYISPQDAEILQQSLSKKDKDYAVRIKYVVSCWEGPKGEPALYEPEKHDRIYECEGIKFVVDKEIEEFAEEVRFVYGPSYFGDGFKVKLIGKRDSSNNQFMV